MGDDEDLALLALMGHGQDNQSKEVSDLLDLEAVDEDEEANGATGAQDAFEEKFGVVKDLLAQKKVIETAELAHKRMELDALRREEQDKKDIRFFERVFIDGEIDLLNRKRNMRAANGEKDLNFVSRDAQLAEKPEDFLSGDEEKNEDCFDENGNFLPVWKIRLNRARREKFNSLGDDFFSSDEEDDPSQESGLTREQKVAKRKAKLREKLLKSGGLSEKVDELYKKHFGDFDGAEESENAEPTSAKKKLNRQRSTKKQPIFKNTRKRSFKKGLGKRLNSLKESCTASTTAQQHGPKSYIFNAKKLTPQKDTSEMTKKSSKTKQQITKNQNQRTTT